MPERQSAPLARTTVDKLKCFFGGVQTKMSSRGPRTSRLLEVTPRDQGSELSSATMIPQMTVVADLTRSEDCFFFTQTHNFIVSARPDGPSQ